MGVAVVLLSSFFGSVDEEPLLLEAFAFVVAAGALDGSVVLAPAAGNRNRLVERRGPREWAPRFRSQIGDGLWFRLALCFADQFDQMMIFDVLDLIGENYKTAIDLVQIAPLKLMAEFLAALR